MSKIVEYPFSSAMAHQSQIDGAGVPASSLKHGWTPTIDDRNTTGGAFPATSPALTKRKQPYLSACALVRDSVFGDLEGLQAQKLTCL